MNYHLKALIKRVTGFLPDFLIVGASKIVAGEVLRRENIFAPSQFKILELFRDSIKFQPDLIVDIGANCGDWSRMARSSFPSSRIFLIEPLEQHAAILTSLSKDIDAKFASALLASQDGIEVPFCEMNNGSSVYPEKSHITDRKDKTHVTSTLDLLLEKNKISGSNILLKIDVQGFELEVLKGSVKTLSSVSAILVKLSFIPTNQGAPNCAEVIKYLNTYGFVLADIPELIRRKDNFLWQADFLFLSRAAHSRISSEITADNWWC